MFDPLLSYPKFDPSLHSLVKLSNSDPACVDKASLPRVSRYKWYVDKRGHVITRVNVYTKSERRNAVTRLARLVLDDFEPESGLVVTHLNGNKLDNRLTNLHICTLKEAIQIQRQNQGKLPARPSLPSRPSLYKGVCWSKTSQRWVARYWCPIENKRKWAGSSTDEAQAARLYNRAMRPFVDESELNPVPDEGKLPPCRLEWGHDTHQNPVPVLVFDEVLSSEQIRLAYKQMGQVLMNLTPPTVNLTAS
jgi:hypothetical protein